MTFCLTRWKKSCRRSLYYLESNLLQSKERVTHIHTNNGSAQWFSLINGLVYCIMLTISRNSLCCYTTTCRPAEFHVPFSSVSSVLCFVSVDLLCVIAYIFRGIPHDFGTWTTPEQQCNQNRCVASSRLLILSLCHLSWGVACVLLPPSSLYIFFFKIKNVCTKNVCLFYMHYDVYSISSLSQPIQSNRQ